MDESAGRPQGLAFTEFTRRIGATGRQIATVEAALGVHLPEDYTAFLGWSNGGEGWLGALFVSLWATAEIIESMDALELPRWLPGVVAIGSDGGGECFAFDYRGNREAPVLVRVPFDSLEADNVIVLGPSFTEGLLRYSQEVADEPELSAEELEGTD